MAILSTRHFLDSINRIDRIEEDSPHARLTLHAASALKAQSRKGRLSGFWIRSGNREISVSRILGLEKES